MNDVHCTNILSYIPTLGTLKYLQIVGHLMAIISLKIV